MLRVGLTLAAFSLGFWLVIAVMAFGWARELREKKYDAPGGRRGPRPLIRGDQP